MTKRYFIRFTASYQAFLLFQAVTRDYVAGSKSLDRIRKKETFFCRLKIKNFLSFHILLEK